VLELLRRACAVFPASAQLANMLGRALHLAGLHAESHAAYARALDLKRSAQTFRAEYPQEDGTFYFGQFAEQIQSVAGKPR